MFYIEIDLSISDTVHDSYTAASIEPSDDDQLINAAFESVREDYEGLQRAPAPPPPPAPTRKRKERTIRELLASDAPLPLTTQPSTIRVKNEPIDASALLTGEHIDKAIDVLNSRAQFGYVVVPPSRVTHCYKHSMYFDRTNLDWQTTTYIVHANNSHWITMTNWNPLINHTTSNFYVFDSLNSLLNINDTKYVLWLLFPDLDKIDINLVHVQQQTGDVDCGLFALAYADLICRGKNPAAARFNQTEMRNNWNSFLTTGELNISPTEYDDNHVTEMTENVEVQFDRPPAIATRDLYPEPIAYEFLV